MRLGLLLCDHVRPGFEVVAGDYPRFFERLLPDMAFVTYDLMAGEFPTDLDECDGWITTGSRHFVSDDLPWVRGFAELVRRLDRERKPLVGICFGAQMIAHALGGEVGRASTGWAVGFQEVEVLSAEKWMSPPADSFRILHSNADQIKSLPPRARLLGRSPEVPVSMLAVDDHIIGFQGHPEFNTDYAAVLIEARRGVLIPDETVEAGLATLNRSPDSPLLASWISGFYQR